jgi:hypothetical protein
VSACVLCWWGVLALVHAGVCFGRDLGLFVGRRAGGGSGGGAGKDALFVELWKACAGPLATVPPLGEKVYYFPQGHIEQVSAQLPGGRTLFPLMVVVLFFPRGSGSARVAAGVRVGILAEFRAVLLDRCEFQGLEGFWRGIA